MDISINQEDFFQQLVAGNFTITVIHVIQLHVCQLFYQHFQASRATFQHKAFDNTTVRNNAMDHVKDAMEQVTLTGSRFDHPIPYTFMYVQWEANKVILFHHLHQNIYNVHILDYFQTVDQKCKFCLWCYCNHEHPPHC